MKLSELWKIETGRWIMAGFPPDIAEGLTIIRWALLGDLRPLSAALKSPPIDPALLGFIVEMIDTGRLQMKQPRRGSPKRAEALARNVLAAFAYEAKPDCETSDEAFDRIANALGISHQAVRLAVTRSRKTK